MEGQSARAVEEERKVLRRGGGGRPFKLGSRAKPEASTATSAGSAAASPGRSRCDLSARSRRGEEGEASTHPLAAAGWARESGIHAAARHRAPLLEAVLAREADVLVDGHAVSTVAGVAPRCHGLLRLADPA